MIEYDPAALKDLKKLNRTAQRQIVDYMDGYVALLDNPRSSGKRYISSSPHTWRYRTGDYRVICEIQETTILVIKVGHRKNVYD